ncbi:MAG: Gfo/Idh/MocA family oxidoreductase [Candidatus Sumerlaeota bacterium]|nr:Gfo/Idh/MocA family oxidoreductase [Candidatus Sumerlaeota bacterium]
MDVKPVKIGIVGCGNISGIYFKICKSFRVLDVAACADLIPERAQAKATEHGIPRACSVKELLADPAIEIVVNLTIPAAHYGVAMAALEAGKSTHGEKPLALTRDEGKRLVETARRNNLRLGSAPDTFLGGGIQTCRKLIDDGWIGQPVAAEAFMTCHGHEGWHPDPEFYYKVGGGPVFDMGPYYLTALVSLIGPVKRVAGMAKTTFAERRITSKPKYGAVVKVDIPTHVTGVMEFANGAVGTMIMSFDVWGAQLPRIEVHGSEASLLVPDPNGFGGPVRIRRAGEKEWQEVPLAFGFTENSRGLGVADMALAIRTGSPHRTSGDLAYHVLDVIHAFHDAAAAGRHVEVQSACERPAPLPLGWRGL